MATKKNRSDLRKNFQNGLRPIADHFADVFESCVNYEDDLKEGKSPFTFPNGITIGKGSASTALPDGTIRWDGNQFVRLKSKKWDPLGGSKWEEGTGNDIFYTKGKVGIGASPTSTYLLQVSGQAYCDSLTTNSLSTSSIRFPSVDNIFMEMSIGIHSLQNNLVPELALFVHDMSDVHKEGTLHLNPLGGNIFMFGGGGFGEPSPRAFKVWGDVFKSQAGPWDAISSDNRVKTEINPYSTGLETLIKLTPVSYKYNGKAQTPKDGKTYLGFIAQDVQKIDDSLVEKYRGKLNETDNSETDLFRVKEYPLIYMLINSIKELHKKVQAIEQKINR